jgi:hypothetical protein
MERARSTAKLRASLVEQNHEAGVVVQGSDATIEATIVRATQPNGHGIGGRGVEVHPDPVTLERSKVEIRASLLEQNHEVGAFVAASDATIEATIVRATQPGSSGIGGHGISVHADPAANQGATLALRASLVEESREIGVAVVDSEATIEATIVRATGPNDDGKYGDGVAVSFLDHPSAATLTSTRIEGNARAGIANFSASVLLTSSAVVCNPIDVDGEDVVPGHAFSFDGSEANLFGCDADLSPTMVVQSAQLSAPTAIDPLAPQG